jgi:hypothetical protein
MLDVALSVVDVLLLSLTTYMGIHIGLHPREAAERHRAFKIGFACCVIVVSALTGFIAWRNVRSQKDLSQRIDALKKEAAQPHPAYASLQFEVLPTKPPGADGRIRFEFIIHNKSNISAGEGSVWIHACDKCAFVDPNPGFMNFSGPSGKDRLAHFDYLDAGVHTDIWRINLIVPRPPENFDLALFYSCHNCEGNNTDPKNWLHVPYPPFWGGILDRFHK